jgi:predicted nucleotidyltransferase component of viral defense system
MIDLRPEHTLHKSYLNRLLIEIVDRPALAAQLVFKGGTCAAMLGYLDRFSVDLDFDLTLSSSGLPAPKQAETRGSIRSELHCAFNSAGVTLIKEFPSAPIFQVRYPSTSGKRNTIKISVNTLPVVANHTKAQYFPEVDRLINSQTIESMFANKLVAVTDRYQKYHTIAGRDIYDIHYFFVAGFTYDGAVIKERTGLEPAEYFAQLVKFIKKHVTQATINEDLNTLLPLEHFQQIRKVLIPETLALLERVSD